MQYLGHTHILKLVVYLNFNLTGQPVFYPGTLVEKKDGKGKKEAA